MRISSSGDGCVAWSDMSILFSHFLQKHWKCFLGFIPKVNWSGKSAEDLFNCFEIMGEQGKYFSMKKFWKEQNRGVKPPNTPHASAAEEKNHRAGEKERKCKQLWWKRHLNNLRKPYPEHHRYWERCLSFLSRLRATVEGICVKKVAIALKYAEP